MSALRSREQGVARLVLALGAALALTTAAWGAGTPAGTVISNSALVDYSMDGASHTLKSNLNTLLVDDKVSFTLTAADTAEVTLTPGGRGYLTYILTNTGNAPHDFTLAAAPAGAPTLTPGAGPLFYGNPAGSAALPLDANAGGLPFVSDLGPDSSRTVYLYLTAPGQFADGKSISYLVTAEAYQPGNLGALPQPVKSSAQYAAGAGADKSLHPMTRYVVLADGHGSGDLDRDGRYSVLAKDGAGNPIGFRARSAAVGILKSATVTDRFGGSQPVSGATISYTLTVTTSGSGRALGVVIKDPIPANTSYLPGTLKLNGAALSDAADGDAGEVGEGTPGTVTVRLGDLEGNAPAQTIRFDVKID